MQHSTSTEDLRLDFMPTNTSTSSSSSASFNNPQRNSNSSSNSNIPHIIATNAANVAARSTNQTSRTVRSHWVRYTSDNWRHISRTSKFMLIFSITSVVVQFVATVVVLIISRAQYCDKPLEMILIVYMIRLILSTPLSIYQHLNPVHRRRPPSRPTQTNLEMGATQQQHHYPSATQPQPQTQPRQARHDTLAGWIDRAKSALDFFAILWFIIMNWLLFSSSTCSSTAPSLYYLTLTFIVFGYIIITIPIILCAAVIFCLPCVLVGMRVLRVGEVVGMGGASTEDIKNIPVKRYRSRTVVPVDHHQHDDNSITVAPPSSQPSSPPVQPQQAHQPETATQLATKVGIFTKFMMKTRPKAKDEQPQDARFYEPFEIPNNEDAMCAICLSAYEDDELVCHLWCGHHFHKGCVHEWLGLNRLCPLCKRDVRGKDFDEQND